MAFSTLVCDPFPQPANLVSFYGVNGHLTWNWTPNAGPYMKANWSTAISKMQDLGIKGYRNGYSVYYLNDQTNVNSSDGSTFLDFINNYAAPAGIQVWPVALADYARTTSSTPTATETTAYNVGYGLGVDMATNLKGKVPFYEVGNEPDNDAIKSGMRGNANSDFDQNWFVLSRGCIRGTIAGIKSVDPAAKIMQPGGTWLHTAYFDMLRSGTDPNGNVDASKKVDWDLTSWHWYLNNYPPNDDIENPTDQGSFNVLAHIAGWGKPIYITESGANSGAYSDNETNIAAAIVGSYLMQRFYSVRNTYNIKHISLYQLFDAAGASVPTTDNEMKFGLVANNNGAVGANKGRYTSVKNFIAANPV